MLFIIIKNFNSINSLSQRERERERGGGGRGVFKEL